MKKYILNLIFLIILIIPFSAFAAGGSKFIFLSSTIGPIDSGIVATLEDAFEKETGIRVRHVGAGTGAALKMAEKGQIDLVMAHAESLVLWEKAGIQPKGKWYVVYEKGSEGNAATLKYVDQEAAYTMIDRATYLSLKDQIKLVILVEGDEALLNFISLIPVNPEKFPKVNYQDTMKFVQWITALEKGQLIIRDFGKDKYGSPLFFPNSVEWQKTQKSQ